MIKKVSSRNTTMVNTTVAKESRNRIAASFPVGIWSIVCCMVVVIGAAGFWWYVPAID